jgi:hypothetical protein
MKSLRLFTLILAIIGTYACAEGQWNKTVYGNKKVVTKEREASAFEELRVSSGIDVYLKQGDKETIKVEADENLHEYILTEIRNGVLNVYSENVNIRDAERRRVYVTVKNIKSVKASSAGDVVGESPVKSDRLQISVSSAGNIRLEVYAKEINIDISSSGDVTLSGTSDNLEADLSSAGDLNAFELQVKEADVSVSSAGDADISVSERLTASASSAGDINYKGDPKYVDAHSSSAGGIRKR